MKCKRFLSGLFFGMGCALIFVGLVAVVLPAFQNPQVQLVLDSFSAPSDNPLVQAMNHTMRFVLANSWRVLVIGVLSSALGAWMMNRFSPKKKQRRVLTRLQPVQSAPICEPEKANPFAVETRMAAPAYPQVSQTSLYHKPILEKNRIEEEPNSFPLDEQPYYSPRLQQESRAIETQIGSESQSGGRILFRSAYEPHMKSSEEARPEPPAPPPAPSPRIRSTMGQHNKSKHLSSQS